MNRMLYASLILAMTLLGGLAFPVGRLGMEGASPFLLMAVRFAVAGAGMALATARRPQPRGCHSWLRLAVIGVCNCAGVMGCAYYSMHWITSGESAILTFVNPLLVIVLGTAFLGARYGAKQWIGVLIGLLGVAATFGTHFQVQPGTFIGLLGALFFAASTLLIKRWGGAYDSFVMTAYQMIFGSIALFVLSLTSESPHLTFDGTTIGSLLWLILMNSVVQFTIWTYLLRNSDPARTSAFMFLAPFFGVLGGWAIMGERLHWYVGAGGVLIGIGIFLVNWQPKPRTQSRILPAER
ncbi:DMT family transporter [Cohnella lubricantis]|uniref:DMT family transporter n=1 Tax=Cohnella lubricantis TaxID=2163172 RepID=A0A841TBI6_9BACL|nr:DMT family transporter [Cohnella lubricantis]MBB6676738.1 DMT family transporter [Cohnella lubricantis]MBP2117784.1 drug/metabolite transporter (DMT)-like permease [Cohnella lubricantis]